MHGNIMYELALQRAAEQRRAASEARTAREARKRRAATRAATRAARRGAGAPETVGVPAIPDFAHEMFTQAGTAVPEQRPGARASR